MEECKCGTNYQTKKLYIVTIVLKYQKRNNNVLYILLSNTAVLLTGTSWDLMQNREALIHEVMDD